MQLTYESDVGVVQNGAAIVKSFGAAGSQGDTAKIGDAVKIDQSLVRKWEGIRDSHTNFDQFPQESRSVCDAPVSDAEFEQMLEAQAVMAARMIAGELTRSELLKLRMLRWAIDRAELSRHGADLRKLETLSALHENLARQIDRLVAAVEK